ncbi:hypothetical protein [Amycolatopsis alba]|uniref:Uncharacterized protein n=1 Tax=Amycolatopsis alba DSM 44262 TaxID=1125972 RepID=A0A229RG49_AMYAL|nr:hypothetical protein [Amycolatopsis alba]OXM45627.1 hypothetical protein CFP75_30320 [Amycolatopsis alba DSM 44262]
MVTQQGRVTASRENGDMMVSSLTEDANHQIDNVSQQRNGFEFLYDSDVRSGYGFELNQQVQSDLVKANENFNVQLGQAKGVGDAHEILLDAPRQAAQLLKGL